MIRTRQDQPTTRDAGTRAFSLIELLVVIAIIAAVSVISVPVIRGLGQSNIVTSGTQQLLDDLMLARHKAMVGRTPVHVVFLPDISTENMPGGLSDPDQKQWDRLRGGGYTMYALYAKRTLGDQPGKRNDRYITDWRTLPEGVFIATYEYDPPVDFDTLASTNRMFATNAVPFPSQSGSLRMLPSIAFDENGSLLQYKTDGRTRVYREEVIHIAKGSVLVARNGSTVTIDAREVPLNNSIDNYNRIRIDPVSGRARLERPEIAVDK